MKKNKLADSIRVIGRWPDVRNKKVNFIKKGAFSQLNSCLAPPKTAYYHHQGIPKIKVDAADDWQTLLH